MDLISLSDVLKEMNKIDPKGNPVPFSIEVCSYNRFHKKGGKRLVLEDVIIYKQKHVKKPASDRTKIPNHYDNGTRNVMFLTSGEIRKIHIRLIEKFNGKTVYY